MKYNLEKLGEIIELSLNLQKINEALDPSIIYYNYDLETLKNYLNSAKNFPKEILSENKPLEKIVLNSINLIQEAIELHESNIESLTLEN
jgi:hypothetical protein